MGEKTPRKLRGGKNAFQWYLTQFQISNYCFCAISLRELSVCAIFYALSNYAPTYAPILAIIRIEQLCVAGDFKTLERHGHPSSFSKVVLLSKLSFESHHHQQCFLLSSLNHYQIWMCGYIKNQDSLPGQMSISCQTVPNIFWTMWSD